MVTARVAPPNSFARNEQRTGADPVPTCSRSPMPDRGVAPESRPGSEAAIRREKAWETPVLLISPLPPTMIAMARDSQASASNVIQLLEGLTVADLDKVITEAERLREARRESGKRELVEEFRAKAAAMGLSFEELLRSPAQAGRPAGKARQPQKGTPASLPAKYRDPETGATWSGRGRTPKWLVLAEEQGRSREEFAAKG
jgi:DNA-binding protein H-NS